MAQGKFGGGNGSSTAPYLIEDAEDLNAVRNYRSSYFQLVNDINLGNGKYNTGQGWNPIRDFVGYIDGNNHKVINFYINRPTEDFVGFCRNMYSSIRNVIFVNPQVIGHNYVGIICGYYTYDSWNETGRPREFQNISIVQGQVEGNSNVGGLCGIMSSMGVSSYIDNLFLDITIASKDAVAYGIGRMGNAICQDNTRIGGSNCGRRGSWNGFWTNCNCNCPNCCSSNWNCDCLPSVSHKFIYRNCTVHVHKHPSVTTYYGISNVNSEYSGCYVDNSEIIPIVGSGINYSNLVNISYSTNILPNIDKNLFKKEWKSKVEPLNLNKDSIYFKTKDGYVTYNFTTKEFEVKYVKFTNQNSIKIIQNGMTRAELSKIPSDKLKELQDENNKVKIVNCINAHEKIVSKTETVEIKKFKEYLDKNIFRNKIKFDKYNDKIMNVIRI